MSGMRSMARQARRPRRFRWLWTATVALGCGLSVAALIALPAAIADLAADGQLAPFVMIGVLVIVAELRPIVMARQEGDPVSISQAFVFAALYIWGPVPALTLMALAVVLGEILARRPAWKVAFNVGNYAVSLGSAWLVLSVGGWTVPLVLGQLHPASIVWLGLSWVAFHLVNILLVSGMDEQSTWGQSFVKDFWFYTVSTLAVLALSPLVAVVAIADAGAETWIMLPLLLLPLVAVQLTAQLSREREHRALHDPLTGLPNRELLAERIDAGLAKPTAPGERLVVLLLDLDSFKNINDGLGHGPGDSLLVDVARRLTLTMRPGDTLARFGGDEFAVVCQAIPDQEIEDLICDIRMALEEPFSCEDHEISLTASIGVAPATPGATAQSLLRDADSAMHRAKGAGRDQTTLFHQTMRDQATARLDDQLSLRRALERDEMRAHFQPVVDLATGQAVGLEALIRWDHPQRGLIGPSTFIPMAEETGLILPIGSWMLDQALDQLRTWRCELPEARDTWVAVNISPRQLTDPDLVHQVARALAETGMPADRLHLEITETAVMQSLEASNPALDALRDLGVHLIIDDFGMGYSSLHRLKRLPVTALKVDRSFVAGLGRDASDLSIVDAIVHMADSLSLRVIVEGVETLEQLQILRTLGASLGQGYLWSRALPPARLAQWLRSASAEGPHLAEVRDLGETRRA